MRAVVLDVPQHQLDERRRIGADRRDEMWEGVLHMVPAPLAWHQDLGSQLLRVLAAIAESNGLIATYETGLFRPGPDIDDYRVPDQVVARPQDRSRRGVEGRAELVMEILSPGDETYDKLPFYGEVGVRCVLVIEPDMLTVELFVARGGRMHAVVADTDGAVRVDSLGLAIRTGDGPCLDLSWPGGSQRIGPPR